MPFSLIDKYILRINHPKSSNQKTSKTQNEIAQKRKTQVPLREPDLLMVLTGGEMAYTREDGVKIVPIGTLRD